MNAKGSIQKSVLFLSTLLLLTGSPRPDTSSQRSFRPPECINDGLDVGSLDEVNVKTTLIEKAVNRIRSGRFKEVHALLIYKDNKLVLEEYFQGHTYRWDGASHHGDLVTWNRAMLHDVKSVSKSITSACVGIAIEHGYIQSVHQSMFEYLPEHQHLNANGKANITIEHLLTMTSGLEWDEWHAPLSSPENDIIGLWFLCEDQIECILERPLINKPGTSFTYSGGNTIVLGEIIRHATHMDIDAFSRTYLFEPLGIDSANWSIRYNSGVIEAAGSLEITPRAMVKIGATFLNGGVWNGEQIISEQWVEKCSVAFQGNRGINAPGENSGRLGYSYSWWTKTFVHSGKRTDMYTASGWGGQHVMILPEFNTVVVFTGGNYVTKRPPFKILKRYVIPALF